MPKSILLQRCGLLWLSACLALSAVALADETADPADREAKSLFAVAMSAGQPRARCEFDLDWAQDALPDYLAHDIFHTRVRAALVGSSASADFRATLDPEHKFQNAFCSETELKSYIAERLRDFSNGSESMMRVARTAFSFPIFDQTFSHAVVVRSLLERDVHARWGGKVVPLPAESAIDADIYEKTGGRWRFVFSKRFGVS